jgi:hypothetical protein
MFSTVGLTPVSLAVAGVVVQWNLTALFVSGGVLVLIVTSLAALPRPVRDIH